MIPSRRSITGHVSIDSLQVYSDDVAADDAVFDIAAQTRLVLFGDDAFTGVTQTGAGQIRARGPLAIDDGLTLTGGAALVNAAAATQNGGLLTLGTSDDDAALVRNLPGATWTLTDGAGMAGAGDDRFVNLGDLRQSGADATSVIGAAFYNRGSVEVEGELEFTSDVTRLFGAVEGAGKVQTGVAALIGGAIACAAFTATTLRVLGDATVTATKLTADRLVLVDAKLEVSGDGSALAAQTIVGEGEIDFAGTARLGGEQAPFDPQLHASPGAVLTIDGDIEVVNSGDLSLIHAGTDIGMLDIASGELTLSGGAHILNLAGATWTDGGGYSTIQDDGGAQSLFDNQGTFVENMYGRIGHVHNDGLMKLGPGFLQYPDPPDAPRRHPDLVFTSAVDGAGEIDVGSGRVTLQGAVAKEQTLAFTAEAGDAPAILMLSDLAEFAATIAGFAQDGASQDSLVADTSVWTYERFAPDAGASGGALMFSDAAAMASVHLAGVYDPAKFHAAVSGAQTTITYG